MLEAYLEEENRLLEAYLEREIRLLEAYLESDQLFMGRKGLKRHITFTSTLKTVKLFG